MNKNLLEQLYQLRNLTWDGNLISKGDRDKLFDKGLIIKSSGYQVINEAGISISMSLEMLER